MVKPCNSYQVKATIFYVFLLSKKNFRKSKPLCCLVGFGLNFFFSVRSHLQPVSTSILFYKAVKQAC